MTRESVTVLLIMAMAVAGMGLLILRDKRRQRQCFLAKIRRMWGSVADREYTSEELESISRYARKHQGDRFMIDDITWNDLNMDQIFVTMNTTVSSCGEDVLYRMLRIPEFEQETLTERNRLIEYFRSHPKEREEIQELLREVRKFSDVSMADYVYALKDVEQTGVGKYILRACLTLAAIGLIFLEPVAGVLMLMVVLSYNGFTHMKDARKIEPYLNCVTCILRLLKAANGFAKVKNPEIQTHLDRIAEAQRRLKSFQRGAFLMASASGIQDGIEMMILSYVKIMFQVDLIKFYSMLKKIEGYEPDIEELFLAMGELDALIAAASFREYLPYYCIPQFREQKERRREEQVFVEMEDLYHPLIPNPVANSVKIHGGVLVTGSNASGKSTFLKTVAVNAILAQSVYTCVSHSYYGDYLKVMTSMALRDNLEGGESYYIVEIKSLQRILEECKEECPVLCIVDEVLRGTNTIERIAASSRILKSLAKPHVLPLAATHDIELSYILEAWYTNYHFEEEIKDRDIVFSYMLKQGRATTRNAIKLLEIIGYDSAIIREAQETARTFEETGVWK